MNVVNMDLNKLLHLVELKYSTCILYCINLHVYRTVLITQQ